MKRFIRLNPRITLPEKNLIGVFSDHLDQIPEKAVFSGSAICGRVSETFESFTN